MKTQAPARQGPSPAPIEVRAVLDADPCLSRYNFRQFAAEAIRIYRAHGQAHDAALWERICQHYEDAIAKAKRK